MLGRRNLHVSFKTRDASSGRRRRERGTNNNSTMQDDGMEIDGEERRSPCNPPPMMGRTQQLSKRRRNMRLIAVAFVLIQPSANYAFTAPCHRAHQPKHDTYAMRIRQRRMIESRRPQTVRTSWIILAASTVADEQPASASTTPFIGLPSYRRIIFLAATTFLIWVSEPLLSLVDSAAVGRYAGKTIQSTSTTTAGNLNLSSVVQLAALGPATMLCDSSVYLTLFVAMATTNKLAKAFAKHDVNEQIQTLSHVLGVSLVLGIILFLVINFQGGRLLAAILGPAGATVSIGARGVTKQVNLTPEVLRASLGYSRIRIAVAPLAIMGLTSQAALLCAQDTRTPALAVLVASIVNIVGDYVFVAKLGYGVRGAALATAGASLMANSILVGKARRMFLGWKEQLKSAPNTNQSTTPFISFPDRRSLLSLLKLAGPLFFVMVGKILGYGAMTVRAGNFQMVSLACHNVLMRIFFFFATVGDALSQSAQTFLPGLFYQKSLQEKTVEKEDTNTSSTDVSKRSEDNNARTLLKRLLLLSSIAGIVNCVLGRYIAHNSGGTFTTDTSLVSLMARVSPFMGLALLLHPLTMALEGSIIAASDAGYLVGTYVVSLIVLLAQLKFNCRDFIGVWHSLLLFQSIRITQFGARVWKRTASEKKKSK